MFISSEFDSTDPHNGNALRAQTTAGATAVNAQLKADESKLKQVQREDVLQRLLKIMERERAKLREIEEAQTASRAALSRACRPGSRRRALVRSAMMLPPRQCSTAPTRDIDS
jgi:acyl-CoA reductase-like NAD-dependent aldehyde dehydrogenase